jgi:hypothetical protein
MHRRFLRVSGGKLSGPERERAAGWQRDKGTDFISAPTAPRASLRGAAISCGMAAGIGLRIFDCAARGAMRMVEGSLTG